MQRLQRDIRRTNRQEIKNENPGESRRIQKNIDDTLTVSLTLDWSLRITDF